VKNKARPSRQQTVANKLVKQSETNERLREKTILNNFWKLLKK